MIVRVLSVIALAGVVVSTAAAQASPPTDDRPLPTLGGVTTESRVEPRFSAVATNIAGRAVEARCWSTADWEQLDREWREYVGTGLEDDRGYVRRSARHLLHLAPGVCASLVGLTYKRQRPGASRTSLRNDLAEALLTLTHEAHHSKGLSAEHEAECYGLQRVRPAARMLGVSKDYAAVLALAVWKLYKSPWHPYVVSGCRNGGQLDLNPATNIWP